MNAWLSDDKLRVLVPLFICAFFGLLMVAPAIRLRLRTGRWGITLLERGSAPQRAIGAGMGLALAGIAGWGALIGIQGPDALGVWRAPPLLRAAGTLAALLGGAITAIAQTQMRDSWRIGIDRERTALVREGLFRYVRNPIFLGMTTMMAGIAMITPSAWTVMGFVYAATLVSIQARLEEEHLARLHGDLYRAYVREVGRFFPRWPSRPGRGAA